mgnify:CR=1 FL=1|tara:strand:- start:546 stop:2126 length:1581 start_codon:yes stop_codon:yes gene_type:complete
MSRILGVGVTYHDTALAYIEDGVIKGLYEEEKLTGKKAVYQPNINPEKSLKCLQEKCNIKLHDLHNVCFAMPYKKSFASYLSSFVNSSRFSEHSHHTCHALGSYFTSGFSGKVLSISIDGSGFHSRGKIFACENGYFEQVHSQRIPITASLPIIWAESTNMLGWQMLKDEGKVVGLAAHGEVDEKIYKLMSQCIYCEGLSFKPPEYKITWIYLFREIYKEKFKDNIFRANFAATLQKFTEDLIAQYLRNVNAKYPEYKRVCFSGGLFANVKLNKVINELDFFDEIFIHPAMSDAGLALGAAVCKAYELGEIIKPKKLNNCFYGESFSKNDWEKNVSIHQNVLNVQDLNLDVLAQLINQGNVIGLFAGRTEYGPRALGGRSILVRPTDKETHAKLNQRLNRTEIMPFAPSILQDKLNEVFIAEKSTYASEFMTLCYDTRSEWLSKIPAVVHSEDGTSRPQSVNKENNKFFYDIINSYYNLSGIPLILNTSLNAHGEPINNYPHQVLNHLLSGCIDYIVTENFIISKK